MERNAVNLAGLGHSFKGSDRASNAVHMVLHQNARSQRPLQQRLSDSRGRGDGLRGWLIGRFSASIAISDPSLRESKGESLSDRDILGNRHESVRLGEDDALPTTFDDATLFPGTEKPTDCKKGRACHLGDILP